MWIIIMAWKNIWRNRYRSAITVASVFFAVILSILTSSFKTGVFENLIKNMVSFYSGYLQVHQKGYWDEQILDNSFIQSVRLEKEILKDKRIHSLSPRLESFALISTGELTKGCLVSGIDPLREKDITALPSKLIEGNYPKANDSSVLITAGLMQRLKLNLNDTVVLIGQGYHGSTAAGKYPVKGVIKQGAPELNDKLVYMPISLAQDLYGASQMITAYVLSTEKTEELPDILISLNKKIGTSYEVMSWREMMPDIKQHIESDTANMQFVQGFLYLLISFGIFGTQVMLIAERKFELGMLVAIGVKKIQLSILLLTESVITILIGCLTGIIASIPLIHYLHVSPIRIKGPMAKAYERFGFEAIFPASEHAEHFITQGLIVVCLGIILSGYLIYKIIRLNPVEAMRK